jgi:RNA polymerase sigma factor (TIGR02999 family)
MAEAASTEITQLLGAWRSGDVAAEALLLQKLYPMVQGLAARQLRQVGAITLEATDLANEAFIKLYGQRAHEWENRQHFLAIAGRVVRRVVLDHLKSRQRDKRGGGLVHVTLERLVDVPGETSGRSVDWLAVDRLLTEFESLDPQGAQLIELRYFAGLSVEEAAAVQGISVSTAVRNWRSARAWLHARLVH